MSKQLKLRFKKLIKKAEFVQADLEYHLELSGDAKRLFRNAINAEIEKLPAGEREILNDLIRDQQAREQQMLEERLQAAMRENDDAPHEEEKPFQDLDNNPNLEKIGEDADLEAPAQPSNKKTTELKKIFHKIAAITHPDKAFAKGLPQQESEKLENIFKRSKKAYDENNWYVLYAIATDLNIDIAEISDSHLEWVEDDIRRTLSKISTIASLVAWGWYTGCEGGKLFAIKNYFAQMYGYNWEPEKSSD